jgi:hypothetical protein
MLVMLVMATKAVVLMSGKRHNKESRRNTRTRILSGFLVEVLRILKYSDLGKAPSLTRA